MATLLLDTAITPERWIDLLRLYGPMALFIFMVFVLLKYAQSSGGITPEERRVRLLAYSVVWVSIFALAGIIVVVYWKTNFPSEYVVSGTITNLTSPQTISTDEADVFMHRRPVAGLDYAYDWRLIKTTRFVGSIELLLQQHPKDSEVLKYKLPIVKESYSAPVEVNFQDDHQIVLTYGNGKHDVIAPVKSFIASEAPAMSPTVEAVVYAQAAIQTSQQELIQALDADDPLIRRKARTDLATLGKQALPSLSDVLSNSNNSYRLRLGALVAINDINTYGNDALSPAAKCAIVKASSDQDATLRGVAQSILSSTGHPPITCHATLTLPFPHQIHGYARVNNLLYRGGSISPLGLKDLVSMHVETIIDLREASSDTISEGILVKRLGIDYVEFPLKASRVPSVDEVQKVLFALDPAENKIVFIHDKKGTDRVGLIIACYRIQYENWSNEKALSEALDHGLSNSHMKQFIREFSPQRSSLK